MNNIYIIFGYAFIELEHFFGIRPTVKPQRLNYITETWKCKSVIINAKYWKEVEMYEFFPYFMGKKKSSERDSDAPHPLKITC